MAEIEEKVKAVLGVTKPQPPEGDED